MNRVRNSLQDEFREGRSKSVVIPEAIDAVRQLILQERHVTYRETEITLGISETSIHSILHEHLTVKKNLLELDSTQFVNRSKKGSCRLICALKHVYDIVTRMSPKANICRL